MSAPEKLGRLRQLLRELADGPEDLLREFADRITDRPTEEANVIRLAAGSGSKAARYEQRLAQLRRDTARDAAEARKVERMEAAISKLNADTRADRAEMIVRDLHARAGDKLSEVQKATSAGAIRAAARESGLDRAKAVASTVARSVGARLP